MAKSLIEALNTELKERHIDVTPSSAIERASFELLSRRIGMSLERTRMSADRTLMSVVRTSLSLMGLGFVIYQVFQRLDEANVLQGIKGAAATFGEALVYLGFATLVLGIVYHLQFIAGLRKVREDMKGEGYIRCKDHFPHSLTLVTAVVLLLIGIGAILSIVFQAGPFD